MGAHCSTGTTLTTTLRFPVALPCLDQPEGASGFSCSDLQLACHQARLCEKGVHGPPTLRRYLPTSLTLMLTHLRVLQSPGLSNGGGVPESIDAAPRSPHSEVLVADDGPAQRQPSAGLDWNIGCTCC